jgi:hypothetical protein
VSVAPSPRRTGNLFVSSLQSYAQRIAAFNASVSTNPAIKKIVEAAEERTRKGYDLGRLAED